MFNTWSFDLERKKCCIFSSVLQKSSKIFMHVVPVLASLFLLIKEFFNLIYSLIIKNKLMFLDEYLLNVLSVIHFRSFSIVWHDPMYKVSFFFWWKKISIRIILQLIRVMWDQEYNSPQNFVREVYEFWKFSTPSPSVQQNSRTRFFCIYRSLRINSSYNAFICWILSLWRRRNQI